MKLCGEGTIRSGALFARQIPTTQKDAELTTKQPALVRMKADTFRATLRLGLGFKGPVHVV
ncbi:MAG: hypothetical protein EOO77_43140 [Oxalobacteraceae bacterium]|nr:MAG: hypothetical protein EOO77_43140 [Oxalobacteraceae bacterium]